MSNLPGGGSGSWLKWQMQGLGTWLCNLRHCPKGYLGSALELAMGLPFLCQLPGCSGCGPRPPAEGCSTHIVGTGKPGLQGVLTISVFDLESPAASAYTPDLN